MANDSVSAILNVETLDGWEDDVILRGYLKKIGVKKDDYYTFIARKENDAYWNRHDYFGQYCMTFEDSSEYINEVKPKTFTKLSEQEQID